MATHFVRCVIILGTWKGDFSATGAMCVSLSAESVICRSPEFCGALRQEKAPVDAGVSAGQQCLWSLGLF